MAIRVKIETLIFGQNLSKKAIVASEDICKCFVLNILSATNIYLAFAIDKSQGTAFGPDPLWLISVQIKFKLNSSNALSLIF